MPPRPFPFPFRVGNDICNTQRIYNIVFKGAAAPSSEGSSLNRFVPKLLTWPEQQYFYHRFRKRLEGNGSELDEDHKKIAAFLAGRWAAKEAVRKACEHLGSSNGFHSIIILPIALSKSTPGATSRPQALILRNRLPEPPKPSPQATINHDISFDIESLDGQLCEVSISHDSKYASAVALVPVVEEWQSRGLASDSEQHEA